MQQHLESMFHRAGERDGSGIHEEDLVYLIDGVQAVRDDHLCGLRGELGQKQLVAFMRAVLRDPEILVLDEATANIDTVTEQQLQQILDKLPKSTTKVIIAHRLNTIANADEIFFINSGEIVPAGSMQHALDMLMHGKRVS